MSLTAVQADLSLHHLEIQSSNPESLANFYSKIMDMKINKLSPEKFLCDGPARKIIITLGENKTLSNAGMVCRSENNLNRFREFLDKKELKLKILLILDGLKKGVLSINSVKNKPLFVFHTFFIWLCYFLMFFIVKFSITETANLNFEPILLAFIAGAITMAVTNGGIGAYPLAIAAVISQYNVPYESALALGWVVWSSQTIMIIIFGSLSFIFLPILNK